MSGTSDLRTALAEALPDRPFRVELWDGTALEPTNGGGPALTALLGNNSQALVSSILAAMPSMNCQCRTERRTAPTWSSV